MDATEHDTVDGIRADLERLYPDLDTSGFAVTGRLLQLGELLETARAGHLAAHGLSVADFDVLATLRRREGEEGINPRDLQAAVMVSSGGMTKRLDRLEAANLLSRHPDPEDRRGVRIRLTTGGRERIDRVLPLLLDAERATLAQALGSTADRERLVELLRALLITARAGGGSD